MASSTPSSGIEKELAQYRGETSSVPQFTAYGHRLSHNSQSIISHQGFEGIVRLVVFATLSFLLMPLAASAQRITSADVLQLGAAGLPGVGIQLGYVDAGDIFTREALVYADVRPRFQSDNETLLISAGVGVSIRIVGGLETVELITPRIWDLHLGVRFGPGLLFRRNETRAEKNQRFSLFLDPFVRFTVAPRGKQTYFLEAGVHRPSLRAGVWLRI
ncbi:MAG: hypothetical protein HKN37_01245 [Rhodothermales bacterium]|nr:hypothetical protein [Rhodothermales bacterium]